MHFQKLFFIVSLICSMISAFSMADAMENNSDTDSISSRGSNHSHLSDVVRDDRDSKNHSLSDDSSSEDDWGDDSNCSKYESEEEDSDNQGDNAKITSYFSAADQDPFLAAMGDDVSYVRARMNNDGTFTDHRNGHMYVPLYKIHSIKWSLFPFTTEEWNLIARGISPLIKTFNVAECNLDMARIKDLKPYLCQRNIHLQSLCIFQSVPLTVEGCFDFIEVAGSSPVLHHFGLNNVDVDDTVLGGVLSLMRFKRASLETVELGSSISPKGLSNILSVLRAQSLMALKDLYLEVAGDFTGFDFSLLEQVLAQQSRLGINLVFNAGSLIDPSLLERFKRWRFIRIGNNSEPENRLNISLRDKVNVLIRI